MSNERNVKCLLILVHSLGNRISSDGISVKEDKIKVIKELPTPKNLKDIESYFVACSYDRKNIKDFSNIAVPLTNFTRKWPGVYYKKAFSRTPVLMTPY